MLEVCVILIDLIYFRYWQKSAQLGQTVGPQDVVNSLLFQSPDI